MGSLKFDPSTLPILWVALITWGGVLAYLVRLDLLTRHVQDEVRAHEAEHAGATPSSLQPPASNLQP
jgi:hypothetical protein